MYKYLINAKTGKQLDVLIKILKKNNIQAKFEGTDDTGQKYCTPITVLGALATLDWDVVQLVTEQEAFELIKSFCVNKYEQIT